MIIDSVEALEALYGRPKAPSIVKVTDHVTQDYRTLIAASPFAALATVGPEGIDCSPRGDAPGFVRVADDRTLILPDRRGNDRIDSLRNIVRDPRAALLFLIPGLGLTLRVNGRATLSADPELLASFAVEGKTPRSAIVLGVDEVYFQCARAILRSKLWDPEARVPSGSLPTPGRVLERLTQTIDGATYDRDWPGQAAKTLW